MYEMFFELERRPFPTTADTTTYFPSATHQKALELLRACISSDEGIGLVLGSAGTGKTLLCRLLLESLPESFACVVLTHSHRTSVRGLLQAILYDLSLPYDTLDEQILRLRLTDFLMERFGQGSQTLLLIDEAHHLSLDQLEEIRLLTNLEGRTSRAVQVALFGNATLARKIEDPSMASMRQRIAAVANLSPFTQEETIEYVRMMMERVGGSADMVFTATALAEIWERGGGIPRRINQLCHRALVIAFHEHSGTVDGRQIESAMQELNLPTLAAQTHAHHPQSSVTSAEPMAAPMGNLEGDAPTVVEVGAGVAHPQTSRKPEERTVIEHPDQLPQPPSVRTTSRLFRLQNR